MKLRNAMPGDVISCAKIQKASACANVKYSKKDELLARKYLLRYLNSECSTVLVAENSGKIVGHVVFSYDEWNNSVHIDLLFVLWCEQNRGVGSKLLDAVVDRAKKRGARIIFLETSKTNNAIVFYQKNGFSVAGHIDGLYKEASGNAVVMSRKIK